MALLLLPLSLFLLACSTFRAYCRLRNAEFALLLRARFVRGCLRYAAKFMLGVGSLSFKYKAEDLIY